MTQKVPEITYRDGVFISDAELPLDSSDICACWGALAERTVRAILRKKDSPRAKRQIERDRDAAAHKATVKRAVA